MGRHGFQAAIAALFALPLLADTVAVRLGYVIFFLADPKIQSLWGTIVLATGIWSLAGMERPFPGLRWATAVAAVLAVSLYGLNIVRTFQPVGPAGLPVYYGVQSGLMFLVTLGRLIEARRDRRCNNPGG
jgi:cation transport ATPase